MTNYQIRVNISNITQELGTNLIEIRDENNNPVNFCYEQANGECNTNPTNIIWVKVPFIPANGETFLIVKPSSTNQASEGDQVFDFYDDFNGNSLDMSKWITNTNVFSVQNGVIKMWGSWEENNLYLNTRQKFTSPVVVFGRFRLGQINADIDVLLDLEQLKLEFIRKMVIVVCMTLIIVYYLTHIIKNLYINLEQF